jgi:hypothetical protein
MMWQMGALHWNGHQRTTGGGRGSGGQRHCCGKNTVIYAKVKIIHSSPPSLNLTKLSATGIAHDVASMIIALERAEDYHGRRQRPWRMVLMVSGLVLQKKIGVRWNLLTALVLMTIFHKRRQ